MDGVFVNDICFDTRRCRGFRRRLWFRNLDDPTHRWSSRASGLKLVRVMPTASEVTNPARREFLTRRVVPTSSPFRPPWTNEDRILQRCTRCADCITSCPENVLALDKIGFPVFAPGESKEGCTFCTACVEACRFDVFDAAQDPPWNTKISIEHDNCLPFIGVHCESCRDACVADAIRMRPRIGGPAQPAIDLESCTGCGACVAVCPVRALSVTNGGPLMAQST